MFKTPEQGAQKNDADAGCNSWEAKPGFMTMVHLHILTMAEVRSTDAYFVLVNLPQLAMDALLTLDTSKKKNEKRL